MDYWLQKDFQYIWHPFTQMKDCRVMPPILIERARGLKLYDNKGKSYYDTISSWWCNVHGHNHPAIKKAIKDQINRLEHVLFAGFTHTPAIKLAEELIKITPRNLTKVFFSDNGSTAVEVALKMSLQYWQNNGNSDKKRFICFDRAYHGDTLGAMSVSGISIFNKVFIPLLFSSYKVPTPYCYRCPVYKEKSSCQQECIDAVAKILKKEHSQIAAMIVEPLVLAAGGMIMYPKECLEKIRALTKQYNVHLILDEIATGFGRTGKMFACDHVDIQPDFMCLSKGLTAGYLPLAVTLTTEDVYRAFYADYKKRKTFYHGHTYTAYPLGCAASIASLETFKREKTLDYIQSIIPNFHRGLELFQNYKHVGDVRYTGMIGAIELVKSKKKKTPFPWQERIGIKVYNQGLKEGLLLRPLGNIIYFFLPLCVKKAELTTILRKTHRVFSLLK